MNATGRSKLVMTKFLAVSKRSQCGWLYTDLLQAFKGERLMTSGSLEKEREMRGGRERQTDRQTDRERWERKGEGCKRRREIEEW